MLFRSKLIHNMRCRGIPEEYTKWIRRKVKDRVTTIKYDNYYATPEIIPTGMDQGCPMSAVAYQFYSADLIEVVRRNEGEDCVGFVDDTTLIAMGEDLEEAFGKLENIMTRLGGAQQWAENHECHFALDKFGLIGFTRKCEKDPTGTKKTRPLTRTPIHIGNQTIKPSAMHKFLGVLFDQEL